MKHDKKTKVFFPGSSFIHLITLLLTLNYQFAKSQVINEQAIIKSDYLLFMPNGYNSDTLQKWPVLIYLHGAGLENTWEGLRRDFLAGNLSRGRLDLPFLCVIPICKTHGWDISLLNFTLNDVIKKYRVDEDRICMSGASMEGFGAWKWLEENPERFAAVAPVAGFSMKIDSINAWKLRNMPIWVFHSEDDNVVPIQPNTEMVGLLKKYNPSVRFTVYNGVGHASWKPTYVENTELYRWFEEQNRKNNRPVSIRMDEATRDQYLGHYLSGNDTLTIGYEDGRFFADPPRGNRMTVIAESELIFSIKDYPGSGIMFKKENGRISGFYPMEEKAEFLRKID